MSSVVMIFNTLLTYRLRVMHPTHEKGDEKEVVGEIRATFQSRLRLQSTPPLGYKYQIPGWKADLIVENAIGIIKKPVAKDMLSLTFEGETQGDHERKISLEQELGTYTFQDHVMHLKSVGFKCVGVAQYFPWNANAQSWGNPETVPLE